MPVEVFLPIMPDQMEAGADGILHSILYPDGSVAHVGQTIAYILKPGENPASLHATASPGMDALVKQPIPLSSDSENVSPSTPSTGSAALETAIIPAATAARRLARELGVDLHSVKGSGPNGRGAEANAQSYAQSIAHPTPPLTCEDSWLELSPCAT